MQNPFDFWAAYNVGCFPIKERSKDPLDKFEWGQYTDAPASAETREKWAATHKGNHAVIAGSRLIILDWENQEDIFKVFTKFDELCKEHYVVKTGKGYHIYFFCDWSEPYAQVKKDGKVICEVRTGKHYVVGAGCIHPSGKTYELVGKGTPEGLSKAGVEELKAKLTSLGYEYRQTGEATTAEAPQVSAEDILAHRGKDKKLDDLLNGSIESFPSRSEAELSLVCKLLFYGATKEQIWSIMDSGNIGKWKGKSEAYKHLTYNRAIQFLAQKIWTQEELSNPVSYHYGKPNFTQNDVGGPQVSADVQGCAKQQKTPIFYDGMCKDVQNVQDVQDVHPFRGLHIRSLHKFLQEESQNTTKWLIPNLVPESGITMIAAKRGQLKTFIGLHFAACAAMGGVSVLGKSEPTRVLYIDYENGEFEFRRRLMGILKGESEEQRMLAGSNIDFMVYPPLQLDNNGGVGDLTDVIKVTGAKIVFVDTQRRLSNGEENASETSNSILSGLQQAILKTGCSFVLLHHMRKGAGKGQIIEDEMDEIRGSSDITASCSVIYALKRVGHSSNFVLKQLKNRYAPERNALQLHIEGQAPEQVKIVCDGEVEDAAITENALSNLIWEWLISERRFDFETSAVNGFFVGAPPNRYSRRSVADALDILLANERIERISKGHYRMILPKKQENLIKEYGSLKPEGVIK